MYFQHRIAPNVEPETVAGIMNELIQEGKILHWGISEANEELGVGLIAFSPMANGLLSGKYDKNSKFDANRDYRSKMPQFTDDAMDKNQELIRLLNRIADEKKATPGQISLAWMICKKPYIVPIPGTRKVERMKENMGAADVVLTSNEVRELDKALNNMEMSAVFGGSKVVK